MLRNLYRKRDQDTPTALKHLLSQLRPHVPSSGLRADGTPCGSVMVHTNVITWKAANGALRAVAVSLSASWAMPPSRAVPFRGIWGRIP